MSQGWLGGTPVARLGLGTQAVITLLLVAGIAGGCLVLGPVVTRGLDHLPWLTSMFLPPEPTEASDLPRLPAAEVGIDTAELSKLGLDVPIQQGPIPIDPSEVFPDGSPTLRAAQVKVIEGNAMEWLDNADKPQVDVFVAVIQTVSQGWAEAAAARGSRTAAGAGHPAGAALASQTGTDARLQSVRWVHDRLVVEVDVETWRTWRSAHVGVDPAELAREIALRVDEALPSLSDLPNSDHLSLRKERTELNAMQGIAASLVVLAQHISSSFRDAGTREALANKFTRTADGRDGLVDVRRAARRRRLNSLRRTLATSLAVGVGVLVLRFSTGPLATVPSIAISAAMLLLIVTVVTVVTAARPGGRIQLDQATFRQVRTLHALGSAFDVIFLSVGALFVSLGAASLMFGPMEYKTNALNYFAAGLVWSRFSGLPARLARRVATPRLRTAIERDDRRPVLFLRSFHDDALRIRVHGSKRETAAERLSLSSEARFEELLAWVAWRQGPVIAIGRPGTVLQPLGAARDYFGDEDWHDAVRERLERAQLVVFLVGRTEGAFWELARLREAGLLNKVLFVVPPVDGSEVYQRLHVLASGLELRISELIVGLSHTTKLLALRVSEQGELIRYVADGRDDIAYELACEQAMEQIALTSSLRRYGPAAHLVAPSEDVSARLLPGRTRTQALLDPVRNTLDLLFRV